MRHIAFANALLKVSDRVIINPNVYFTTQAKATELVAGMNANYNLSENGETQLIVGAYYRAGDAVVPMIGFEWKSIRFTFSYDATMSNLRNFNNMRGAQELSLMKKGYYSDGEVRQALCPRF